jgi:hypothetical protein
LEGRTEPFGPRWSPLSEPPEADICREKRWDQGAPFYGLHTVARGLRRRCTALSMGFGWMGRPPSRSSSRGGGSTSATRSGSPGRRASESTRKGSSRCSPSGAVSRSSRQPRVRRSVRRAWVAAVPERAFGAGRSRPDGQAHRVVALRRGHGLGRRVRRPRGRGLPVLDVAREAIVQRLGADVTGPLFDGRALQRGYD